MPNLDGGDIDAASAKMQYNVELLCPTCAGRAVVVPGPTCGYTMKKEWPELPRDAPRRKRSPRTPSI